jgi:hypothetical protein
VADCEKENGQWDLNAGICELPETARANDTPGEQAKLEATTFAQCQKVGGEWDMQERSCF